MAKKLMIGVGIVLGLALVGVVFIMHSKEGQETFQMIRKLHGK